MAARQSVTYLGSSASMGIFSGFSTFALTLWIASSFTSSYLVLSLLGNGRSFIGALVSPVTGVWSDRVWIRWLGRRRPFILAGGLVAAFFLAITPWISRLQLFGSPDGPAEGMALLAPLIVANLLFTVALNTMDDIHKALLVDITADRARNRLASIALLVEMCGQLVILMLGFLIWKDEVPDAAFITAGFLMAVGILITVLGVREPPPDVWRIVADAPADPRMKLDVASLRGEYRGAVVFCLSQFAFGTGLSAVLPLISIYTRDILGASVGEAQLLPALLMLSTTLVALPMGRLGDRFGRREVIAAGYGVMIVAALAGLVITTKEQGAVVFVLAGIGTAAVLVLKIPLLADLVPEQQIGAAAGFLAASGSLAAPVASIVGGGLADIFGPRAIFALMAVMVVLALVLMPAVRLRDPDQFSQALAA